MKRVTENYSPWKITPLGGQLQGRLDWGVISLDPAELRNRPSDFVFTHACNRPVHHSFPTLEVFRVFISGLLDPTPPTANNRGGSEQECGLRQPRGSTADGSVSKFSAKK